MKDLNIMATNSSTELLPICNKTEFASFYENVCSSFKGISNTNELKSCAKELLYNQPVAIEVLEVNGTSDYFKVICQSKISNGQQ